LELCPRHAKPLAELVAALAPLGRKPGTGAPKTPTAATHTPRNRADERSGPVDCPECGTHFKRLSGARNHLRDEHGKSLADVGLAEARHSCPVCGSKMSNGQGLAAHVRLVHPAEYAATKKAS